MKTKVVLLMTLVLLAFTFNASAQAFNKDTKMLTISLGGADMIHVPTGYAFYSSYYTPLTGQIAVEGEFGVHKYVGVGFNVGVGGRAGGFAGRAYGGYYTYAGYYSEFNIPIAAVANFHFYQLIADKTGKGGKMKADKLDIYVGASLGTGIALHPGITDYNTGLNKTGADVLVVAGIQTGVRYYFTPKIAINGEFGWGKTLARVGVTINLNK